MIHLVQSSRSRQTGAAVAEVIAMSAVLVPLALLVPYMGKVSDMNQAAISAARYASWERTVAPASVKSDAVLADETRIRFFSNINANIFSNQAVPTTDAERAMLWRDYRNSWILRDYNDVTVQTSDSETPGNGAGIVSGLMAGFMNAMGRFNGNGNVGLNTRGLYRADVAVNVGGVPMAPLNEGTNCAGAANSESFLCIRRHHVILGDTWASGSSDEMRRRVQGLVPTSAFEQITQLTDLIGNLPFLGEFSGFQPGYVAPDTVLPPDRVPPP